MPQNIVTLVTRYIDCRKQSDAAGKEMKDLKEDIFIVLDEKGAKDDKGSLVLQVKIAKESVTVKKECRTGVSLDSQKALEFLTRKGFTDCIIQTPSVDGDALEKAVLEGRVSDEEFRALTVKKESFALIIK